MSLDDIKEVTSNVLIDKIKLADVFCYELFQVLSNVPDHNEKTKLSNDIENVFFGAKVTGKIKQILVNLVSSAFVDDRQCKEKYEASDSHLVL